MPITAQQLERRKAHLGSSDMAAILGLDPFKTKYDIWAMKTGRLPDDDGNATTRAGQYFESGVLEYAEDLLGNLIRNQYRSVKGQGIPIGTNIDAIVVQTGQPVEAKTSGLFWPSNEFWGAENTDEVPDRVIVQATVHMLCTEQELCHVAAFIAHRGFVPFQVRRDEAVIDVIKETATRFWTEFVLADTPPDDSLPTASTIKRMRREPKSIVEVDSAMYDRAFRLKEIQAKITKKRDAAQLELLASLGDAEAGQCENGDLVTFLEQDRKAYSVEAAKFRVCRYKKAK